MEDQLLKRRLSTPRAATVVVLTAAVAVSVTVVPSVAQSFLTSQKAAKVFVSNKKASKLYLKKKAAKPVPDKACPVQILIDGQATGKVNFLTATAASPGPAPIVNTIVQTGVLTKGGHTVAVQYAGAKDVAFGLKNWNLAVEATPQPDEPLLTEDTGSSGKGSK